MSGPGATDIAAELERASRETLAAMLRLLGEAAGITDAAGLVAFQAEATGLALRAALADASLLARVAARSLDAARARGAATGLADRALRSPLAHAGEPPDYDADNE